MECQTGGPMPTGEAAPPIDARNRDQFGDGVLQVSDDYYTNLYFDGNGRSAVYADGFI